MPGSPPISTTAPGTMPPPSTRSSSDRPVGMRAVSSSATWSSRCTPALAATSPAAAARPLALGVARPSTRLFQAPHSPHWPCHFGYSAPHSWQK